MDSDSGSSLDSEAVDPPRRVERFSGSIRAQVRPPGSKSLTNRAIILAALCRGDGVLRHPLRSDDTDGLVKACETLGTIIRLEGHVLRLDGGDGRFPGGGDLNLGAGGTPTRFMVAAANLARLPVRIDGSPRMRERPVGEGVAMMEAIGASIDFLDRPGCLPLVVRPSGTGLRGGVIDVARTASSQFVSAVMLVAASTEKGVALRFVEPPTSPTYLELTLDVLARVGVEVSIRRQPDGGLQSVEIPPQVIPAFDIEIEPDASSAVYPAVLAASHPGSRIEILGLGRGSRQPDAAAIGALEAFGCRVEKLADRTIVESETRPNGVDLDCEGFPDAAVGLAVLAAMASGPSRLFGLETLRVKECDRVAALAIELRKVGCTVTEEPGELHITPPAVGHRLPESPISIGTWDDHRMAMAFAVLGRTLGPLEIEDPDCVGKSHPGFWEELESLVPAEGG
ncbi:MAG: 3-phosphoshikimate 1-carboxyvinyltransferase [Phycisphaerae bacterium]|nr:3-phosphoshikimate 1-carboxyvinyltransferase [Phycisphaerae bacterium]